MTAASFNTLKLSETLHEAGMPEVQAKAVSHALHETLSGFATKRDLHEAVDELRVEMRSLRSDLKADVQLIRTELGAAIQSVRSDLGADNRFLRAEVGADIQILRAELRVMEPRLMIRLGGTVVVALGAFTALSKWIG